MHRNSATIFPLIVACLSPALFLSSNAQAAETSADESPWSGAAELGASISTGNSQTSSVNGKFSLKYEQGPWSHRFKVSTLQSSEDGASTANRTVADFSSRFAFDLRNYAFDSLRYSHDAFSGYTYQASVAAGLGRKFWVSDLGELSAEAGPGYRKSKTQDGTSENNLIGLARANFRYNISDTAKFEQSLTVLGGAANTELESESALSVNMTKTLALKVAYTVQHNTKVPVDTKKTDTFTSINLVYAFGK
ncbi:MAG: hypothetical protein B7X44_09050 [Halothiobacillus sp. 15-55-196]|jgi:putative salt-induced outer membrane protein|uniref:DUF481 domain-containing protein n=1 Tax=Halothiobacillus sp. 15-55-196 TaxID=1970382 RepID=UPI000BCC74A8|nr:DUF481 domain-containing protein [Halothiobacillus sp. 15-55-196]OZB35687.1 MAG: hypothetical protein B7X44_09050 [Halothiobacillus sp. 15-55-196]